jgi:ribosomal 50S subunit-recycling heat shock protein
VSREAESRRDEAAPNSLRLDLFLKISRLIPRRSLARDVCEHGVISVNGRPAKSAHPVRIGDLIEWRQRHKVTAVKVARIPSIRPGKQEAATLYESVRTQDGRRFPEQGSE